ncbi:TPA: gfo/Idh/MocA family oxidoreductase [Candidatus Latescibacteria bacterium]|nr:gfo/Idh/MocA family oxidoreductase [Candidatus Latescibacterota bacterium]
MLNWGIIGPGNIARVFCNGLRFSKTGSATAVASRDSGKAEAFASMFDIGTLHGSYDALLADESVDAVYIATIHPAHIEWVTKAAQAGKHILVEKPMGMNEREATVMIDAAKQNDVFLMEAFMYRCHPQIQRMADLIQDGAIGEVRVVRSAFGFHARFNPESRSYNYDLAGGGIMDVGCYPSSASRRVAGAAAGQTFLNPIEVKASGVIGESGVDYYAAAVMKFENDIVAEISTGVACALRNDITIHGTDGVLTIPNPWLPSTPCRTAECALPLDTTFPSSEIHLTRKGETKVITVDVDRDLFTYEADTVAENIETRQAPAMSWKDSLGNIRLLDAWRDQIGLVYPQDRA